MDTAAAAPSRVGQLVDWFWLATLLPLPIIAVGQFVGFIVR
jgi:hypothetical protein